MAIFERVGVFREKLFKEEISERVLLALEIPARSKVWQVEE